MDKRNFAFDKTNFILLAVGMAVVIVGFLLMAGICFYDLCGHPQTKGLIIDGLDSDCHYSYR